MKVKLADLRPNPFRDFVVDPIDDDVVSELEASINQDGWWEGIVGRDTKIGVEIGFGHHRVEAAKKAGMKEINVVIRDYDDEAMVRIYARENATQRGANSSAMAGSVAGAIKHLASCGPAIRSAKARQQGIGAPAILKFLDGVPGVTKNSITEQLSNLHDSGDYLRIIKEVQDQLDKEQKRLDAKLEKAMAKKAKESKIQNLSKKKIKVEAAKHVLDEDVKNESEKEPTFDFGGVKKHLKNPSQVKTFKECVTSRYLAPNVPVDKQEALAKKIIKEAEEEGEPINRDFIRRATYGIWGEPSPAEVKAAEEAAALKKQRSEKRKAKKAEREAQAQAKAKAAYDALTDAERQKLSDDESQRKKDEFENGLKAEVEYHKSDFAEGVEMAIESCNEIKALQKKHPDIDLVPDDFSQQVGSTRMFLNELHRNLFGTPLFDDRK